MVEDGHPVQEVAERLGVSQKSLYTWLRERKARMRGSKQADSHEAMKAEIARLKAELNRTTEERNILRKAAAYFAKASDVTVGYKMPVLVGENLPVSCS